MGLNRTITKSIWLNRLRNAFFGSPKGRVVFREDGVQEDKSSTNEFMSEEEEISLDRLEKTGEALTDEEFIHFEDCWNLHRLVCMFEDGDDINVFDLSALEHDDSARTRLNYKARAWLCGVIQIVFPIAVGMFGIIEIVKNKRYCFLTSGWGAEKIAERVLTKITGVLAAMYLSVYMHKQGMKWEVNPPLRMLAVGRVVNVIRNPWWITFGEFVAICNLGSIGIVSLFVIYVAESPIELVLNSLALFFLAEVDELLVKNSEKNKALRAVKEAERVLSMDYEHLDNKKREVEYRILSHKKSMQKAGMSVGEDEMNFEALELRERFRKDFSVKARGSISFEYTRGKQMLAIGKVVFKVMMLIVWVSPFYIAICQ